VYPTLSMMLAELKALDRAGALRPMETPIHGGGRFRVEKGRDVNVLAWPGAGEYKLNREQLAVVSELAEAYLECDNPDVGERALLVKANSKARRLEDVFRDSPAWGSLVLRGRSPATYRIAALPEEASEPQVTRGGDDAGWIDDE
jgi:hypothetical protein